MKSSALNSSVKSVQNYFPFVVDTQDIRDLDDEFDYCLAGAERKLGETTIFETKASYFEILIPKQFKNAPMWIIRLPDEFSENVEALACQEPWQWEFTSVDLQTKIVTVEWHTATHRIIANLSLLSQSIGNAHRSEPIVVAIVTPSRTAFSTFTVDDDFIIDFGSRHQNYRRYYASEEYSTEEIELARTRAVLMGGQPIIDEDGLHVIQLDSRRYIYCAK